MARPRKPTNVLQLAGAFKKNPARGRERANEPKPNGPVGDPDAWMDETQRKCRDWIIRKCPAGVLGDCDEGILEIAAQLRAMQVNGQIDNKGLALLKACYTELGMTPASRSKVQAAKPDAPAAGEFAAV